MRFSLRVVTTLLTFVLFTSNTHADQPKLNVLFIAVDDLRPELNCYGQSHIKSPNIDALAAQGLRFDRAYCQYALCNPSRASLLTGRRPETLKVMDLKTFVRDASPDVITLPEHFKNNGYRALSFGKIFHTSNGNHEDPKSWSEKAWKPGKAKAKLTKVELADPGKSEDNHADDLPAEAPDCADEDLSDGMIARAAIDALRKEKERGTPFFIGVGFNKPHLPFVAPKRYWDLYDPASIKLAANGTLPAGAPAYASNDSAELRRYYGMPKKGEIPEDVTRQLLHGYYACVSYMDAQVGLILAELDKLGLRENTVVIFWGDHGYQLGEHGTWNKRTNWEVATRVPMILSTPKQPAASVGKSTPALVELVDIYPTLVELCGLPSPAKLEGKSMVPLLTDPTQKWKDAAFSVCVYERNVPALGGKALARAIRTDRYRLVEWASATSDQRIYELYDHQTDPQENTNIADKPENKALVESLAKRLHVK